MDISALSEFDKILPIQKSRLLTGAAGLGKSAFVRKLAKEKGARLIDLRLSEYEPTDIVGMPYLDNDGPEKVTKYARPWWWPTDPSELIYLFIDEIDRIKDEMHPIAMQLSLDRRAGSRNLHDNVVIWAACNGPEYLTSAIDQALMDRMAVVDFTPTVAEWLKWASEEKLTSSIIEFITANPGMLDTPKELIGKPNIVCASRRSWADLAKAFANLKDIKNSKYVGKFAAPFIGVEYAAAFERWIKESYKTFSTDEIFSGQADHTQSGILELSFVAKPVADEFMKKTDKQQRNAVKFFINGGREAFAAFYHALPVDAAPILMKISEANDLILTLRNI